MGGGLHTPLSRRLLRSSACLSRMRDDLRAARLLEPEVVAVLVLLRLLQVCLLLFIVRVGAGLAVGLVARRGRPIPFHPALVQNVLLQEAVALLLQHCVGAKVPVQGLLHRSRALAGGGGLESPELSLDGPVPGHKLRSLEVLIHLVKRLFAGGSGVGMDRIQARPLAVRDSQEAGRLQGRAGRPTRQGPGHGATCSPGHGAVALCSHPQSRWHRAFVPDQAPAKERLLRRNPLPSPKRYL